MPTVATPLHFAAIESRIHLIRGRKVMLDGDLAQLYGVATKNLNKDVARNFNRFPGDFMYQLTRQELTILRFQIGTSKQRWVQWKLTAQNPDYGCKRNSQIGQFWEEAKGQK